MFTKILTTLFSVFFSDSAFYIPDPHIFQIYEVYVEWSQQSLNNSYLIKVYVT